MSACKSVYDHRYTEDRVSILNIRSIVVDIFTRQDCALRCGDLGQKGSHLSRDLSGIRMSANVPKRWLLSCKLDWSCPKLTLDGGIFSLDMQI